MASLLHRKARLTSLLTRVATASSPVTNAATAMAQPFLIGYLLFLQKKNSFPSYSSSGDKGLHLPGKALLLASVGFSLLYYFQVVHPLSGYLHALVKWLAIIPLTAIVLSYKSTRQDLFLICAIVFHSVGDVVLAHPVYDLLLYSLFPFLLGHIFYILTFKSDLPSLEQLRLTISRQKLALLVFGVSYIVLMSYVLLPTLLPTPMGPPVVIYMVIFSILALLSILPRWRIRWMTLGTWLYILSDSLIAVDRFYMPLPPMIKSLSWPLYYIGQILISMGIMMEKGRFVHLLIPDE